MNLDIFDTEYRWEPTYEHWQAGFSEHDLICWQPTHTPHFAPSEMACRCCGVVRMLAMVMDFLENARSVIDKPLVISSGYRCPKHNNEIGGAMRSAHLLGAAVDVRISGIDAYDFVQMAMDTEEITGIGIKQHGAIGSRFVHVDVMPPDGDSIARPRIWSY